MNEIKKRINEILKLDIDDNDILDINRAELICNFIVKDYEWDEVQNALISLLVEERKPEDYNAIAQVFWYIDREKYRLDSDKIVALINYRCNPFDQPYENNLAWSVTSELYGLDYADSEYNPFRDEKIISILNEYGLL